MNIVQLFHDSANRYATHPAIIDDRGTLSFGELSELINKSSVFLKANNIKPGMGVGVLGSNSREFIIMAYAVMQCNAVVLPLSDQLRNDELQEVIQTAGLHALLTNGIQQLLPGKNAVNIPGSNWKLFFIENVKSDRIAPHVPDAALIRFTSGTTGVSKGVTLSHTTILERITTANGALQLGPGDRVLWVLSMAYHFVVSIMLYLHHGTAVIICNEFMASGILEQINKYDATFLYASPMHIRMLANDSVNMMMENVKRVVSTSTAISKEQCEAFYSRFQKPVSQAYGIIEIGLPVINFDKALAAPDAIGYAVPGYHVAILDDNFIEVPAGIIGHLAIKGPGMLDAYLSPPALRNEILQHGWFMTGDLASKDENGLITVKGRKKSMINVAGNKVFPEEVESVLNRHPAVRISRVSGYRHPLLGESVQAEIILHENSDLPDTEALRNYCREHLSPHKIPQKIIFNEKLLMTGSGKVKRI